MLCGDKDTLAMNEAYQTHGRKNQKLRRDEVGNGSETPAWVSSLHDRLCLSCFKNFYSP